MHVSHKMTYIKSHRLLSNQGWIQGGVISVITTPKTYGSNFLFTMILYNSENSIRDIRPFCHPLFSHSNFVKYTSSLLQ